MKILNMSFIDGQKSSPIRRILEYTKPLSSPVEISTLNSGHIKQIDNFYLGVQLHREQYKDRTGASHPLDYFKKTNEGLTWSYFNEYPVPYVTYKVPLVFSQALNKPFKLPLLPDRKNSTTHDRSNCIKYKR